MSVVNVRYKPANRRSDLPPGSKNKAMDAFLMSDQIADPTRHAARDIAAIASAAAAVQASDTGEYASSFEVHEAPPIRMGFPAYPRRTFHVVNSNEAAAAVEFGNIRYDAKGRGIVREPLHILRNAGEPLHTPRGM